MANWCNGFLSFQGKDSKKLKTIFKRLANKCEKTQMGQTLKVFNDDTYLFDIYVEDDYVNFETKWGPPTNTIMYLLNKYNVDAEFEYQESGMQIYGKIIKKNGIINHISLSESDISGFDFDITKDCYIYKGEEYECEQDILDEIYKKYE